MDLNKLKVALDSIVNDPLLKPSIDSDGKLTTYCNIGVQRVLNAFGYHALDGLMADDMCNYLAKAQEWMNVNSGIAQSAVNEGQIGIAAHPYSGHGHVACIAPGKEVFSGHWGCMCPIVCNIGKSVGYMGANMAFPIIDTPPSYFLLKES